jgi:DNA-binding LacI/PurR family transcriptional regulator
MANQESQRVSLRDVAEKAKVTRMTVSLALRGHPSLPEASRRRIQAIARELGHRRDPVVSDLMSKLRRVTLRSNAEVIAIVTSSVGGDNQPPFKAILSRFSTPFTGPAPRSRHLSDRQLTDNWARPWLQMQ